MYDAVALKQRKKTLLSIEEQLCSLHQAEIDAASPQRRLGLHMHEIDLCTAGNSLSMRGPRQDCNHRIRQKDGGLWNLRRAPVVWCHGAGVNLSEGECLHNITVQHGSVNNIPGCIHESEQSVVGAAVATVLAVVENNFDDSILYQKVDFQPVLPRASVPRSLQ